MKTKVKRVKNAVVVCSHQAFAEYLRREGYIDDSAVIVPRAKLADIRGKVVFGSIPLFIAYHAAKVIHVPLKIPAHLKNKELTPEQFRKYALRPALYTIKRQLL